jgi:uncharacterized protein YecT (DUF1311 family)
MGECVKDEMDAVDRELNGTYNSLYGELRRSKGVLATELAKEQREWVKYRWKDCDDKSRDEAGAEPSNPFTLGLATHN